VKFSHFIMPAFPCRDCVGKLYQNSGILINTNKTGITNNALIYLVNMLFYEWQSTQGNA